MTFQDRLVLLNGQTLKYVSSREKGFMGETDVDTYDVVDATGTVVGRVVYEKHIAVKGFKVTERVEQRDATGKVIVETSWHPRD